MPLGEMTAEQSGEVKTAETLDELREHYLRVSGNLYGERLLLERSYRALDILTGDELNPDYSEIKSPRRTDFMELSVEELSAEIEKVEAEYRRQLTVRKEMEANVASLIVSYQTQAEGKLPTMASIHVDTPNRRRGR